MRRQGCSAAQFSVEELARIEAAEAEFFAVQKLIAERVNYSY